MQLVSSVWHGEVLVGILDMSLTKVKMFPEKVPKDKAKQKIEDVICMKYQRLSQERVRYLK